MIKNILVTLDFWDRSMDLLHSVFELFPREQGREYYLLHVVPSLFGNKAASDELQPEVSLIEKTLLENAKKEMFAIRSDLLAENTKVSTEVLTGEVDEVVARFCKEHHIDLIVLSTHGRKGVPKMVLGSVAGKILRISTCPVIIMNKSCTGQSVNLNPME